MLGRQGLMRQTSIMSRIAALPRFHSTSSISGMMKHSRQMSSLVPSSSSSSSFAQRASSSSSSSSLVFSSLRVVPFGQQQTRGFAGGEVPYSDPSQERLFGVPKLKEGESRFYGGWEIHYVMYWVIIFWGMLTYKKLRDDAQLFDLRKWAREEALHTPETAIRGPIIPQRGVNMRGENANYFPGEYKEKLEVNQAILRAGRSYVLSNQKQKVYED